MDEDQTRSPPKSRIALGAAAWLNDQPASPDFLERHHDSDDPSKVKAKLYEAQVAQMNTQAELERGASQPRWPSTAISTRNLKKPPHAARVIAQCCTATGRYEKLATSAREDRGAPGAGEGAPVRHRCNEHSWWRNDII